MCRGTHPHDDSVRAELLLPPRGGLGDRHLTRTAPVAHPAFPFAENGALSRFLHERKERPLLSPLLPAARVARPHVQCSPRSRVWLCVCHRGRGGGSRMDTDTSAGLQGLPGRSCFLPSWRFGCLLEREPMNPKAREELHDITGSSCLLRRVPHRSCIRKPWHHPRKSLGVVPRHELREAKDPSCPSQHWAQRWDCMLLGESTLCSMISMFCPCFFQKSLSYPEPCSVFPASV